jgi:hypothetical protein
MPGAPDLRTSNPLKKLVADAVAEGVAKLVNTRGLNPAHNIEYVLVRRCSDLRTEVEVVQRVNSADFPPRRFTVQVIEHQ